MVTTARNGNDDMSKDQEVIDFGMDHYLKELDKDLSYVDIGILPKEGAKKMPPTAEGKQTDVTLAQLAVIQEFGIVINVTPKMRAFLAATGLTLSPDTTTITIPSRPFVRQTFDENESNLADLADELVHQILTKQTTMQSVLNDIGQTHVNQIQKNMSASGKFKKNHPYTIKRKKSSQPLINIGRLKQAINYGIG